MADENSKGKKTGWEKVEIVLRPAGALFAAITVAFIGLMGRDYMEERQSNEMRLRLYTELMSQREEAESALRKDMFTSIMDSFLEPGSETLEPQVLQLELLAHNFHESLNLTPLFLHLKRRISNDRHESLKVRTGYRRRLEKVAREIIGKQIAILEVAGLKKPEATPGLEPVNWGLNRLSRPVFVERSHWLAQYITILSIVGA